MNCFPLLFFIFFSVIFFDYDAQSAMSDVRCAMCKMKWAMCTMQCEVCYVRLQVRYGCAMCDVSFAMLDAWAMCNVKNWIWDMWDAVCNVWFAKSNVYKCVITYVWCGICWLQGAILDFEMQIKIEFPIPSLCMIWEIYIFNMTFAFMWNAS